MRGAGVFAVVVIAAALFASSAFGQAGVGPWDGHNPFLCEMQQAGTGSTFTHPDADPFCVEYDKTNASISDGGIADFLSNEPARLAAASPKCFYYQVDHWHSDLIAGNPATEIYNWDGAYFFDKRTGMGGVHVTNFRLGGMTANPATLPGMPADWAPFFGPGTGGVVIAGDVPVNPNCLPKPGSGGGGGQTGGGVGGVPAIFGGLSGGPGSGNKPRAGVACRSFKGNTNNGIGRAKLGMKRTVARRKFGKPTRTAHGFYHYCLRKGGDLAIHFGKHRKADLVITNGKSFHSGKVKIGSRLSKVRSSLKHEQVLGRRKNDWVIGLTHKRWLLLVGVAKNRVVYIAAVSRKLSLGTVGKILTNSGK
jgi:hypothetical protein